MAVWCRPCAASATRSGRHRDRAGTVTGSDDVRRRRRHSLRRRLAIRIAATGFALFVVAGGAVVVVTGWSASNEIEGRLEAVATQLAVATPPDANPADMCSLIRTGGLPQPAATSGHTDVVVELHGPDGEVCQSPDSPSLSGPESAAPLPIRLFGSKLPQVTAAGASFLVLDEQVLGGWSVRIGGDLTEYNRLAGRLLTTILVISLPGAGIAALSAYVLTRNGLRPISELADTAAAIARTQDLSVRIEVSGQTDDEVARLAATFNQMTEALAQARDRQTQLIADAGHELRTPLTSIRTNFDLLVRSERVRRPLPPAHRDGVLADLDGQIGELTHLIDELLALTISQEPRPRRTVDFAAVVSRAVQRAKRRSASHHFWLSVEPWSATNADEEMLERAVVNLLDNAIKFAPPHSTIRVRLAGGRLTVDDEGPGVPEQHRHEAFERFWRDPEARRLPGSGLGLAIVAEAAGQHGGSAALEEAEGGGTRAVLTVPGAASSGTAG